MIEFAVTAVKLVGPLTRITASLVGGDSAQREQVAVDLDNIAGCTREIAHRLQADPKPDIMELVGRLDHFSGMISRTLYEVVAKQDTSLKEGALLTQADVASFSKRLHDIAIELRTVDAAKKDKRNRRLVDQLKIIAGHLGAQAEEIRTKKNNTGHTNWRKITPAIAKVGTGLVAGWTAVEAASSVSFERIGDNYGLMVSAVSKLFGKKEGVPDDLDEDSIT